MSLNIRSSAPAGPRPRSLSTERPTVTVPVTTTIHSTSTRGNTQYTRPGLQLRHTDPEISEPASDPSTITSERGSSRPPPKLLRFHIPTAQSKDRQGQESSRRRSPEGLASRGQYVSESDNESLWNSSEVSSSTQATSVVSKDDSTSTAEPIVRPTVISERHDVGGGPSRRQTNYSDYSQDQGRTVHIHIQPKQQHALPSASSRPAITSRQPPMITQASHSVHESDYESSHRGLTPYSRGGSSHAIDNSGILAELHNLRTEVVSLRERESRATTQVDNVNKLLERLQKENDEMKSEESKLQKEVDQLEEGNDKRARQLDKTKDKVDGLKKTMEKLEKEHNMQLERAKKDRTLAIQKIHKDRDQTQERLEKEHEEALKKLQSERDLLSQTKATLEEKLKETEGYLNRHKELNDKLEQKCLALEKETQQFTDYKGLYEAKSINLERELNDNAALKKAQESSYVARIATLEISLEARELRISNLEDDLKKSTTECGGLVTERDKLRADLKEQLDTVMSLRGAVSALEKTKEEMQAELSSLKTDKAGLEESLKKTEESSQQELATKNAHIATIETENQDLKAKVEKAQEEMEAEKSAHKTEATSLNEQIDELKKQQDASAAQIEGLEADLNGLRNENASLRESSDLGSQAAEENASRAETLKEKNAKLQARNAELQAQTANIEVQLQDANKALKAAEKEAKTLGRRIVDLDAQLATTIRRGRPKTKRDPKKAERILAVRCPRDEVPEITVVRRKNIDKVRSSSSPESPTRA